MKFLIAALAMGATLTPAAQAAALIAPAPASDLDRLVLLLIPEQGLVDMMMVSAGKGLDEENSADFARYPGMRDYVLAQLRPDLLRAFGAGLPELRASIGAILSRELTADEIGDLYAFFSSPTGKKLYAIMLEVAGENAAKDEDTVKQIMMDRIMASMTPEDYGPMSAFGGSSAAGKMQTISPQIRAASMAWANKLVVANAGPIRTLRDKAIADYKRAHPETGQ